MDILTNQRCSGDIILSTGGVSPFRLLTVVGPSWRLYMSARPESTRMIAR
jgi:hypothetical protein